jgi:hypothetical protein
MLSLKLERALRFGWCSYLTQSATLPLRESVAEYVEVRHVVQRKDRLSKLAGLTDAQAC